MLQSAGFVAVIGYTCIVAIPSFRLCRNDCVSQNSWWINYTEGLDKENREALSLLNDKTIKKRNVNLGDKVTYEDIRKEYRHKLQVKSQSGFQRRQSNLEDPDQIVKPERKFLNKYGDQIYSEGDFR